jgi:hypothetical protein
MRLQTKTTSQFLLCLAVLHTYIRANGEKTIPPREDRAASCRDGFDIQLRSLQNDLGRFGLKDVAVCTGVSANWASS